MAEWFHARRYGWGAGPPCSWQGWLLLAIFLLLLILAGHFIAPRSEWAFIAVLLPLIGSFVLIVAKTTKGGLRWHWGKDKDTW